MDSEVSEFVNTCHELLEMIETFGDDILGADEQADFNSLDEFDEALVSEIGDEFVFAVQCSRDGITYNILGSPSYEFFEITSSHSLYSAIRKQLQFTEAEQEELSEDEQYEQLSSVDIDVDELEAALASSRTAPLEVVQRRVYTELNSQTDCTVEMAETSRGDIIDIEARKKLFVNDDEVSRSDIDSAIVAVRNVTLQMTFLLSEFYNIDGLSPEFTAGESDDEQTNYHH